MWYVRVTMDSSSSVARKFFNHAIPLAPRVLRMFFGCRCKHRYQLLKSFFSPFGGSSVPVRRFTREPHLARIAQYLYLSHRNCVVHRGLVQLCVGTRVQSNNASA